MITCKQILLLLSEYFDQELDPVLCEGVQLHLDTCPHCLFLVDTFRSAIEISHSFGDTEIPREVHHKLWEIIEFEIHSHQMITSPVRRIQGKKLRKPRKLKKIR